MMARKPLILDGSPGGPNSGVLAWAGPYEEMRLIREQLGKKLDLKDQFGENIIVSKSDIGRVVDSLGFKIPNIQIAAVTFNDTQGLEIFNHKLHEFSTRHVGMCYAGGTGGKKLSEIIEAFDAQFDFREVAHGYTPADAFAEHISASWLYMETDSKPGPDNISPIATSSGGFLDWYRTGRNGVRSWHPRLDLHLRIKEGRTYISRAYLSETLLIRPTDQHDVGQAAHIVGLIEHPEEIVAVPHQDHISISRSDVFSYLCPQVFRSGKHLSAFTSAESLQHLYARPLYIPSIHVLLLKDGSAVHRPFRSLDESRQAIFAYQDGRLHLSLPQDIIFRD